MWKKTDLGDKDESNDILVVLRRVTGSSNLQKKTHEAGLLDVLVEPAPAPGWWQLLAQHGGNIGVPDTVKNVRKMNLLNKTDLFSFVLSTSTYIYFINYSICI